MDNNRRQMIDVPLTRLIIHPRAQQAYEFELDLQYQCMQRTQDYPSGQALQLEYPQVMPDNSSYQVIAGWSQLLTAHHDMNKLLTVICVPDIESPVVSNTAWRYVLSRMLNQVHHPTYCAQLRRALEKSHLSHSDIEELTGVSAKTIGAIARKLSRTSLSTSKRQLKKLQSERIEKMGEQL